MLVASGDDEPNLSANEKIYITLQDKLFSYERSREFFHSAKFGLPLTVIGSILFGTGLQNHAKGSVLTMATLIMGVPLLTHTIKPVTSEDVWYNPVKAGFKGFLKSGPVAPSLSFFYYEDREGWDRLCDEKRMELERKGFCDGREKEEFLSREVLRELISPDQQRE
jgi:hypothetical protein